MSEDIVVVNGCFDIFHAGHAMLLNQAAMFGKVIVLLNSDRYVREVKKREPTPLSQREYLLLSLKAVNDVDSFDSEKELYRKIKAISPRFLVKGTDYLGKPIVGEDLVEKVIFVPFFYDISSSKILELKKQ